MLLLAFTQASAKVPRPVEYGEHFDTFVHGPVDDQVLLETGDAPGPHAVQPRVAELFQAAGRGERSELVERELYGVGEAIGGGGRTCAKVVENRGEVVGYGTTQDHPCRTHSLFARLSPVRCVTLEPLPEFGCRLDGSFGVVDPADQD